METVRSLREQGQLAVVRQRRYVVTDVQRGMNALQIGENPQHLVSLASVEDDALGEELQVIWEIEPGALAFEKMALPESTGFDAPAHLEAFLDAVRWGAASIADTRQLFPLRTLEHIPVAYSDEEQRIHTLLTQYAKLRADSARDNEERLATEFVMKLLKKRLFSSPQAFLNTLNRHRTTLRKSARFEALTHQRGIDSDLRSGRRGLLERLRARGSGTGGLEGRRAHVQTGID